MGVLDVVILLTTYLIKHMFHYLKVDYLTVDLNIQAFNIIAVKTNQKF